MKPLNGATMALPSWRVPIVWPSATGSKLRQACTNASSGCSRSVTSHRLRHSMRAGGGSGASVRRRWARVLTIAR